MRGSMHEVGEGHWRLRVFAGRKNRNACHISRYLRGAKRQAQGAFYHSLQEKGLSGSSIHRHHSILHASLGRAVKGPDRG